MEKYSQFRDRGNPPSTSLPALFNGFILTMSRIGHRALSAYPLGATRPPSTPPRLPLLLSPPAIHFCHSQLLFNSTMASHRIAGQESCLVVYSWRSEHLVD
jgi:hypothetical protein